MLEIKISINGSDFYVSDEGHTGAAFGTTSGSVYYYPFVTKSPTLTLGATKGGFITVMQGNIAFEHKPYDSAHPFSKQNFRDLLANAGTTTDIPTIAIKDETKYAIFEGTLVFQAVINNEISFSIYSTIYEQNIGADEFTDQYGEKMYSTWPFGYVTMVKWKYTGSQIFANGSTLHPGFLDSVLGMEEEGLAMFNTTATVTASTITGIPTYAGKRTYVSIGNGVIRNGNVNGPHDDNYTNKFSSIIIIVLNLVCNC